MDRDMMNNNQRKQMQNFFRMINVMEFSKKYYKHGSYTYLVGYVNGKNARTKLMDSKLQSMILDYHDDCFEIIQKITHKIKE